jgi:hypothetical protein
LVEAISLTTLGEPHPLWICHYHITISTGHQTPRRDYRNRIVHVDKPSERGKMEDTAMRLAVNRRSSRLIASAGQGSRGGFLFANGQRPGYYDRLWRNHERYAEGG